MFFIFVQIDRFGQVIEIAVHANADIAASARVLKDLGVLALLAADDRGEDLELCPFGERRYLIDNLIDGLLTDLPAALWAVRYAYARIEQP